MNALDSHPVWRLTRGANVQADGSVTFSVWAPNHRTLALRLLGATERELPMARDADGESRLDVSAALAGAGTDCPYVLPTVGARPDPVSRAQPHGVHEASRVVAADDFAWTDGGCP